MVNAGAVAGTGLRQWCRAHGVAPSTLHKAVVGGLVTRRADGSIEPQSAAAWLAGRAGRAGAGQSSGNGAPRRGSVAAAQRKLLDYKARLARLEWRRRRGELVEAREVASRVFACARTTRDRILDIPDRMAAVLAGTSDAVEVHRLLRLEIESALGSLSDALPKAVSAHRLREAG